MVVDYPYFGFPNYMKHMNPGFCFPNTSRSIPNNSGSPNNCYSNKNYNFSKNIQNNNPNYQFSNTANHFKFSSNKQRRDYSINCGPVNAKKEKHQSYNSAVFNILGINLYFDDVLIILVIFFLYNENVNDPYLFIVLILLLLT